MTNTLLSLHGKELHEDSSKYIYIFFIFFLLHGTKKVIQVWIYVTVSKCLSLWIYIHLCQFRPMILQKEEKMPNDCLNRIVWANQ